MTGTKFACGTGQWRLHRFTSTAARSAPASSWPRWTKGHGITTIEGFPPTDGGLTALQEAIVTCADVQCGSLRARPEVMSAAALIEEQPDASAEDVRGPERNLCRYTAYGSYVEAVRQAAEGRTP